MPYKSEKIRIAGTQYDRRIKLTPDQKEYIKWLREKQLISYSKLAKIFGVSKRLIQFICCPDKYFKALSDKDLEDEDMLFGVGRDIAQVELELYILCQIILGIGWDANKMGKWFWQSNKDRDLVILKNWVTVEK